MPPKASKGRKRRGFKPRRRFMKKSTPTTLVNTSVQPIATRYISRHKYSDTFQLTVVGGQVYRFNLNSMWDPNRSGTGHQPYGRDQLATLYNRYRVYKVSYALSFYNASTASKVAVCPANIEMGASTVAEIMENPQSKWAIQIPGGAQKIIKGSINLPRLTGRTKSQYMADDRYQSEINASPQELLILNIFGASILDVGQTIDCAINLTYHCEWFDRNSLSQS